MSTTYTVNDGDCMHSIAARFGFLTETLWNAPSNSALKALREDPSLLFAGDIVQVPDKRPKKSAKPPGAKHSFIKKSQVISLRLQLLADGKPRSNLSYTIDLDGILIAGTTSNQGIIDRPISRTTYIGKLLLKETGEEYLLGLGFLDPVREPRGIQARLKNLGYYEGDIHGEFSEETVAAIKAFQSGQNLNPSGKPDDETLKLLTQSHGC